MAKDAIVSEDMAKKFATEKETPYTKWVKSEGLEIQSAIYQYDLHVDYDVEITDTYHWTPQKEVKRFEWEAGDVIYVPPNTASQHFNSDPDRPVRLISAVNRIYKACGLNDLEQLEDAPEYRPDVKVTPELVQQFLTGKIKQPA